MIAAVVPVRICDLGGWTDTWFGGPGRVLNIAVRPGVEASIAPSPGPEPVLLDPGSGVVYPVNPGGPRDARHGLLEAAIDCLPPPRGLSVAIRLRSAVPPGCGAGTSAAVAVALLGGLAALRGEHLSPREVARAAHRLEVDVLGQQSGIQDQLSAALGGINYLSIDPYPETTVRTLPAWPELGRGLTLVFLGRARDSSEMHERVIRHLHGRGSSAFARLRSAAVDGRDAVLARDLASFGRAMAANTQAQEALHPDLVGVDARQVIEVAASHGALGWKVNGAGGAGGSLTVLHGTPDARDAFAARVEQLDRRYRVLPIEISAVGLQVTGAE